MGIIYGTRSPQYTSPDVDAFLTVHPLFLDILELGKLPIAELIPILRWVPERWAKWKREARRIKKLHNHLFEGLLRKVEERLAGGLETGAFLEDAIKNAEEMGLDRRELLM